MNPQQPIVYWWRMFKALSASLEKAYNTVYCISIDSMIVHYLLSCGHFNHLEAFNGSTDNILTDSIFYHPPSLLLKQKWLRKLLGV